jgi:hypothetical protein
MGSSDLNMELVSDNLELIFLGTQLGKLNMDRSSQSSAEVCGAGSNIAESLIKSKLDNFFNMLTSSAKSVENSLNISALLHRNDS